MTSPNADAQITGLIGAVYTPQNPGETKFQVPMAFDTSGFLLYESPVGSGTLARIQGSLVNLPANASMIATLAQNRVWMAYSNLQSQLAPMAVYDLKRQALEPFGQKPFGWNWQANTAVLVGEYGTPSITGGNGHLYRCIVAGTTAGSEPGWPTGDSVTFTDGTVTWQESTPVAANTVPPPGAPALALAGGGTFASGLDIYVVVTLVNPLGETLASAMSMVTSVAASTAVQVTSPTLPSWVQQLSGSYLPTSYKVYVVAVSHGSPTPPQAQFLLVGSATLGSSSTITASGSVTSPPRITSARITPSGLQPPDSAPPLVRNAGGGGFTAGRDVYVIATALDAIGETTPSPAGVLVGTAASDAVVVNIPGTQYQVTGIRIYEADVPTGSAAPPNSAFALVGTFQPNSTATISVTATGAPPPTVNTAGTVGNIGADTTGNFRYVSFEFVNNNGAFSGFTPNSVISCFIDVPGFEVYIGKLPIGPGNVKARVTNFTIADGTNAGPFWYIPPVTTTSPASTPADVVNGVAMSATRVNDNTSTSATFDFTDDYLQAQVATNTSNDLRLTNIPPGVDLYYSPSTNRMFVTGCDGIGSGHYISLAGALEQFYSDTSLLQIAPGDGEMTICVREFANTLYSLKERSGHIINPNATDPSSWGAQRRWGGDKPGAGVGPCGPRAVDVCSEFMIFAHRSGLYVFTGDKPELISTEIPITWSNINWAARQTIWVHIDAENKEVRIGVPLGNSTVPNKVITMNYFEGQGKAIRFSAYVQKEVALAECRKWSLDDIAANVCVRMERQLPAGTVLPTQQIGNGSFQQSQICFGSSAPDGTVQAIVPGIANDNGAGIDQVYETACPSEMMSVSMLGGVSANMRALGQVDVSVMVARTMKVSPGQGRFGPFNQTNEIKLAPFISTTPENWKGYSGGGRGQNERFRIRFSNGKRPDNFFDLKYANLFGRPLFTARTAGEVSSAK